MNWNSIGLDKLENLYAALGEFLQFRRRAGAAEKIAKLKQERQQISLEMFEAKAQLSAHQEMAERLMSDLKISPNGHGVQPSSSDLEKNETNEPEEEPMGITLDEPEEKPMGITLDEPEEKPIGITLDEPEEKPIGITLDEPEEKPMGITLDELEEKPIGIPLDELDMLNIGEW